MGPVEVGDVAGIFVRVKDGIAVRVGVLERVGKRRGGLGRGPPMWQYM